MNFSWFMHLFIFLLPSICSSSLSPYDDAFYSFDTEEEKSTTESVFSLATISKITTDKHSAHIDSDETADFYPNEDTIEEEGEESTTVISTTTPSSFSEILSTPDVILETTTNKTKTTTRQADQSYFTTGYHVMYPIYSTTSLDSTKIAFYQAKANRERLLLKMFVIAVLIGMSTLAIALIIIHIVRKKQHYHGYGLPNNGLANKHSTNIQI